ncbi:MAG TPA: 16S rRNA (cytidine(1402)-2'-O)-methyltransferase [Acidisarcina sp.]|nr:16S rRNA (cytidine(1402)-2'-O)-methyltransferase [Acidisarcina sp.]
MAHRSPDAHGDLPPDTAPHDTPLTEQESEDTAQRPIAPGLYLVGTPIGNLEDITLRAIRVLRAADRIACEDTRQTQKLLNHFDIRTPTVSCHEHNEQARAAELLELLQQGGRVAVVSDAGMPGISDPGMTLAAAALAAGIPVIPIPGANAALSGLVASGLNTESFLFLGFLPSKAGERRTRLEALAASAPESPLASAPTLIFYEAPHRILETLADAASVWGDECRVVVARELTKLHEEFLRGTVREVRESLASRERIRGEITLLIEGRKRPAAEVAASSVQQRLVELEKEGLTEMEALKKIARERGQSKSEVYRELQRQRARR